MKATENNHIDIVSMYDNSFLLRYMMNIMT